MELRNISIVLAFSLSSFLVLFLMTDDIKPPKNIYNLMPWQSYVNHNNKTVALGLIIGESKLSDAMKLYGKEAESALFRSNNIYDLEIYFDNTKIGGLSGKLVIGLNINNKLKFLLNNIKEIKKLPNNKEKIILNKIAQSKLFDLKIKYISFIPNTQLDEKNILGRFGQTDSIKINNDIKYFKYPNKGLKIIFDKRNKEILEYANYKN
ncbi:hypothetical protein MNB_SUP05-5-964 [hydrothermal vent metagenome]|uniref:Uncharacterized protein n=1 Tax=hydrothermal vent metagenome TaxID=652676 RepID=A0A1W1CE76_9ZZZZ